MSGRSIGLSPEETQAGGMASPAIFAVGNHRHAFFGSPEWKRGKTQCRVAMAGTRHRSKLKVRKVKGAWEPKGDTAPAFNEPPPLAGLEPCSNVLNGAIKVCKALRRIRSCDLKTHNSNTPQASLGTPNEAQTEGSLGDWRSGSAVPRRGKGRVFESRIAHCRGWFN